MLIIYQIIYINKQDSSHPPDIILQKLIDNFFANGKLNKSPKYSLEGTPFQLNVWKALTKIPKGHTESYSSLASKIGAPGAARAVGTACKLNPIPLLIPCHRVIKQDGSIGEFALGKTNKKYLLAMEAK